MAAVFPAEAARRDRAVVVAVHAAHVEIAGRRRRADGAAGVDQLHVLPVEGRRQRAAGVVVQAGAVGEVIGRREARVRPGHRRVRLHRPAAGVVGADAGVGHRVDAARDLLRHVVVRVLELDHLARAGVHRGLPGRGIPLADEPEGPDQAVAVPLAHRPRVRLAVLEIGRRERDDFELRLHPHLVAELLAARVVVADPLGVVGGDERLGADPDVAPCLGADQDQVPVVDRRGKVAPADRDAVDHLPDVHLPQLVGDPVRAHGAELGRVDRHDVGVPDDEAADGARNELRVDLGHGPGQGRPHVRKGQVVVHPAPGNQGHVAKDAGCGSGPGIQVDLEVTAVVREEPVPGCLVRQRVPEIFKLHVVHADVEFRLEELLLVERRGSRLGRESEPETGPGAERQKGYQQAQCPPTPCLHGFSLTDRFPTKPGPPHCGPTAKSTYCMRAGLDAESPFLTKGGSPAALLPVLAGPSRRRTTPPSAEGAGQPAPPNDAANSSVYIRYGQASSKEFLNRGATASFL